MDLFNTCFATTNEVRALAYYSHLVPIISTLFLGYLVISSAKNRNRAWLFFGFVLLINLWLIGNLVTWTSNNYYHVAGFWSALDYINILFYLYILCFAVFDFSQNRILQLLTIIAGSLATIFPFIITVAGLAVFEFDLPNCEMYGNDQLALYKLAFEWVVILLIAFFATRALLKNWKKRTERHRIILVAFSIIGFLAIFSGSEFLATYTDIYEINLYALFSLPIFILALAYSIIEQKTFKFSVDSLLLVRILFIIFVISSASNLFLIDDTNELITTVASVIVTLGFGIMVLRSAARESAQRKEIEKLAGKLKKANVRLKELDALKSEFVSIASHQLRSPLTAIRGYASLLLEGSYGTIPQKAKEPLTRIEQSTKSMALSIEDYLNVSRIESGNMKYNLTDFNLKDEVEHMCDDIRTAVTKEGLSLLFRSDLKSRGVVHADIGKTQQIIQNLLHNALKYTPKGSIKVLVRDDVANKRISVEIEDTGIGMNEVTMDTIFQKFERANNANSVNVHGTGLGLYVAQKMADAMGGSIVAHSEGDGKGSRFTFTLPLAM